MAKELTPPIRARKSAAPLKRAIGHQGDGRSFFHPRSKERGPVEAYGTHLQSSGSKLLSPEARLSGRADDVVIILRLLARSDSRAEANFLPEGRTGIRYQRIRLQLADQSFRLKPFLVPCSWLLRTERIQERSLNHRTRRSTCDEGFFVRLMSLLVN